MRNPIRLPVLGALVLLFCGQPAWGTNLDTPGSGLLVPLVQADQRQQINTVVEILYQPGDPASVFLPPPPQQATVHWSFIDSAGRHQLDKWFTLEQGHLYRFDWQQIVSTAPQLDGMAGYLVFGTRGQWFNGRCIVQPGLTAGVTRRQGEGGLSDVPIVPLRASEIQWVGGNACYGGRIVEVVLEAQHGAIPAGDRVVVPYDSEMAWPRTSADTTIVVWLDRPASDHEVVMVQNGQGGSYSWILDLSQRLNLIDPGVWFSNHPTFSSGYFDWEAGLPENGIVFSLISRGSSIGRPGSAFKAPSGQNYTLNTERGRHWSLDSPMSPL